MQFSVIFDSLLYIFSFIIIDVVVVVVTQFVFFCEEHAIVYLIFFLTILDPYIMKWWDKQFLFSYIFSFGCCSCLLCICSVTSRRTYKLFCVYSVCKCGASVTGNVYTIQYSSIHYELYCVPGFKLYNSNSSLFFHTKSVWEYATYGCVCEAHDSIPLYFMYIYKTAAAKSNHRWPNSCGNHTLQQFPTSREYHVSGIKGSRIALS